MGRGLTA